LSVTTLMDLPSGAITQVAHTGIDWKINTVAARAAQTRRAFIERRSGG
jgi:hypothetical protein